MLWWTKSRRAQSVDDFETWIAGGVCPTLNAFDMGDIRATVLIIDGTRVGDVRVYADDVMQTVISRWGTGGGNVPAIFPISGNVIGRQDHNEPNGKSFGEENDPMYTLTGTDRHAVCFDEWNDGAISEQHNTLRAAGKHATGTLQDATVRRLVPIECERLQGFPDDWTAGQADSHRYKQCGNAVTVNVIAWIGARL